MFQFIQCVLENACVVVNIVVEICFFITIHICPVSECDKYLHADSPEQAV